MAGTNLTVVGNLTSDPTVRFTSSGKAVCSFTVAVGRRKKDGDRWVDDGADFFRVTAWQDLGQNVSDSLEKGQRVVVTGRLSIREYEDKEGARRTSVEITADEVGPSLRWATAEVEKADRSKPDETRAATADPSAEEVF